MSERQFFRLAHDVARNRAVAAVLAAEEGSVVTVGPPTRNLEQNALLHAALTDIAEQVTWSGQTFDLETWKRLCTAAWLRERGGNPQMIPALDGHGFDIVYQPTSKLSKGEFSELCEWVFMFGATNGVTFREPAPKGDGR
jgi:hypothetical protein